MGGGGPTKFWDSSQDDIYKKIQDANDQAKQVGYDISLSNLFSQSLGEFNNRDHDSIKKRIELIKNTLGKDIDGVITTQFGGSLARKTHIDGLSDVDTLVILNDTSLEDKSPAEVLEYFYQKLKGKFGDNQVEKGDTAVSVSFDNGVIQLLPALKYKTGIKISDEGEWSNIVAPSVFARKLTVMNQELNGRLIPAIKLIKSMISHLPETAKLKGYHIESLAIEIFSKNEHLTVNNIKDIVIQFFKMSPTLVEKPIKDSTGQTFYVDEYLGKKQSVNRLFAADALDRISRRLEIAESTFQDNIWENLIHGNQT